MTGRILSTAQPAKDSAERLWNAVASLDRTVLRSVLQDQATTESDLNSVDAKSGRTALLESARMFHLQFVVDLLDAGAHPNILERKTNFSLLHYLARVDEPIDELSRSLLKSIGHTACARGCSANQRNSDGQTPLHIAASSGAMTVATLLLDHDAVVNIRDDSGVTPLLLVVRMKPANWVALSKLLLAQGADPTIEDDLGVMPLSSLQMANSGPDVREVLLAMNKSSSVVKQQTEAAAAAAVAVPAATPSPAPAPVPVPVPEKLVPIPGAIPPTASSAIAVGGPAKGAAANVIRQRVSGSAAVPVKEKKLPILAIGLGEVLSPKTRGRSKSKSAPSSPREKESSSPRNASAHASPPSAASASPRDTPPLAKGINTTVWGAPTAHPSSSSAVGSGSSSVDGTSPITGSTMAPPKTQAAAVAADSLAPPKSPVVSRSVKLSSFSRPRSPLDVTIIGGDPAAEILVDYGCPGRENLETNVVHMQNIYQNEFFNHAHFLFVGRAIPGSGFTSRIAAVLRMPDAARAAYKSVVFPPGHAVEWINQAWIVGEENVGQASPRDLENKLQAYFQRTSGDAHVWSSISTSKSDLPSLLLGVEIKMSPPKRLTIGVIFYTNGRQTEQEALGNVASPSFQRFANLLGRKLPKNWSAYDGGAVVTERAGGGAELNFRYTSWRGYEVVIHVAPELTSEQHRQFIGNDKFLVLFLESGAVAPVFRGSVNSVGMVVQYCSPERCEKYRVQHDQVWGSSANLEGEEEPLEPGGWRVASFFRKRVTGFCPSVTTSLIRDAELLREVVLCSAVNGTTATLRSPPFSSTVENAFKDEIEKLSERFVPEAVLVKKKR